MAWRTQLGVGYGSEWHLMWYLARHRTALNDAVAAATGAAGVDWLDFPVRLGTAPQLDEEWKGLDFITSDQVSTEWRRFWPHGAGIQNWDAIGLRIQGRTEWLLVEAKANREEIRSDCGAKAAGGLDQIRSALDATKAALGVEPTNDWLRGYYQFCNRLAVLQFLNSRSIPAHLLMIYFTGDQNEGRMCPGDASGWSAALAAQQEHVGLPSSHRLSNRLHKVFLPVFANARRD
jgi:hypothetical protein